MKLKMPGLGVQILLGLILGAVFGGLFPDIAKDLKPLGDVFIRMVKMIVVPLVFSSLLMGIAGTGDFKQLGRLGGKAILWFEFATTFALLVGLVIANLFHPGSGVTIQGDADLTKITEASQTHMDHIQMLVNIVPTNIIDAMARQDMLQVIFFACLFAIAAASCGKDGQHVIELSRNIANIMFKVTNYVMHFAPIGVFGAIAYTIGTYGFSILLPLAKLIGSLYFALALFLLVIILLGSALTKINFFKLMKALKEPLVLAFTTASGEAALPLAMEKLEQIGVPNRIVSFVLPLGYTFNLDGSTLYASLATLFIAQVSGIDLPIGTQILMMLTLMLSTKGIAAVPGAGLIVTASTAVAFGLPLEGVALLLGVERILDMARTICNVAGNCMSSVIVAAWEKEVSADSLNFEAANREDNHI